MTSTLLSSMGSGVVLPSSGVLMNNGVMWFDPVPGRPNAVSPGRRPLTNMCPVIVREGEAPTVALGASGGRRILAAVTQTLLFVEGFGMDAATAADHPASSRPIVACPPPCSTRCGRSRRWRWWNTRWCR